MYSGIRKGSLKWMLFGITILLYACSSSSPDDDSSTVPSNLEVNVEIEGKSTEMPNGDGSGKITLNFSADNANSYRINFGNGETAETTSNNYSYTYVGQGTHTFQIYVSAYNAGKFISKETAITIYVAGSLQFADEFNGNGSPDGSKWGYDTGANGWGNNESQFYTTRSENVKIENGVLKITARKENYEGASYTSARLKTQGKFSFKYGRIEVRAKLPEGGGTWPAIWMLGSNFNSVGWPACGEIDIMEHIGNEMGKVHSTLHTPSSYGASVNSQSVNVENVSSEFHVYAANWTAEKIEFSVDGEVFYTYNPSEKNASTWPFNKEHFIIMNVAMGGNFGGEIDPSFTQGTMEIDYVRVYQ